MNIKDIHISTVSEAEKEEVIAYVLACRKILFPTLDHTRLPNDLQDFSNTYIGDSPGVFLQARDAQGNILGVVAMMPYVDRFAYLDFSQQRTVEVARLFVEPAYRKMGLGSMLVQALEELARQRGLELLYLHTHPFLEGAFSFWQKQGFEFLLSKQESGFETWHMRKLLTDN